LFLAIPGVIERFIPVSVFQYQLGFKFVKGNGRKVTTLSWPKRLIKLGPDTLTGFVNLKYKVFGPFLLIVIV